MISVSTRDRSRQLLLSLALLAVLAWHPAHAQEENDTYVPLWEVRHEGSTVYLMGSVHLLRPEVYPLDDALYQAFDEAGIVAFEIDFAEMMTGAVAMAQRGMLPEGESLETRLPAEVYADLMSRSAELGLPEPIVARMKPWMASLTLSSMVIQAGGYEVAAGIDHHFYERAHVAGKSVIAFETLEEQLEVFDGLDEAMQVDMLRSTLDDLDETVEMLDRATVYWQSGRVDALAEMFVDAMGDQSELLDRLLYERNRNWIPQIEALLEGSNTAIVIVGIGHLAGENSVVDMLRARGYEVIQRRAAGVAVE